MKNIKWINLLLELFVVIIGVTIAFSLDSWRESKKSVISEYEYLMSFKYDLERDTAQLQEKIDTISYQRDQCQRLLTCLRQGDLDNENLLDYSISLFFDASFLPHSATYKSLTSSGQLQTISDFELRKALVDHYDVSYAHLRMLDEFTERQAYNYRTPYLHDNMEYLRGRIKNTELMTSGKYLNISYSAFHFLDKKMKEYQRVKNEATQLLQSLHKAVNN